MQRTRCSYFYDITMPCNKRVPGSGCAALAGFNRMLRCLAAATNASPRIPPTWRWRCAHWMRGSRRSTPQARPATFPIADFHRLPGTTPQIDTNLAAGEVITAVTLPPPPPGRQIYRKVRDRASYAFALVSVAAVVDAVGGRIRSARIACGGLAPKPWRVDAGGGDAGRRPGKCQQLRCRGDRIARRCTRLRFQRFQDSPDAAEPFRGADPNHPRLKELVPCR